MSIHLRGATALERSRYAALIRPARQHQGMSQQALADLALVDRTTVSNIERGAGAPQEDVLRRLLAALGLATDAAELSPEVELWTAMMAELLSSVPYERQHLAADAAIATLAAHVRAADLSEGDATVRRIHPITAESEPDALAAQRGTPRNLETHAE